jgi:periplasmic protein TonB
MEKTRILQASLLDIIFDERNKVYGAYELRSKYTQRLSKALLVTGAIASVILLASFVGSKLKPATQSKPFYIKETEIKKLMDDPFVEPPPPIQKPIEQPRVAMIQFTPPRLVHEEIDPKDQMKNVDEIDQAKISTKNVDGIKGVDIAAPPIDEKTTGVIIGPKQDESDKVLIDVQIPAKFPGGDEAWRKYISREMERSLDELQEEGKAGTCTVQFIVDKNGKISDVEVLTMKGSKLAEICANAIRKGPDWTPAENNGMKVKAYRKQPVTFRIDNP